MIFKTVLHGEVVTVDTGKHPDSKRAKKDVYQKRRAERKGKQAVYKLAEL
jgi:hypothetical protein